MTQKQIFLKIAKITGVTNAEILSKSRNRKTVAARTMAINALMMYGNEIWMGKKLGELFNRHFTSFTADKGRHEVFMELEENYRTMFELITKNQNDN